MQMTMCQNILVMPPIILLIFIVRIFFKIHPLIFFLKFELIGQRYLTKKLFNKIGFFQVEQKAFYHLMKKNVEDRITLPKASKLKC